MFLLQLNEVRLLCPNKPTHRNQDSLVILHISHHQTPNQQLWTDAEPHLLVATPLTQDAPSKALAAGADLEGVASRVLYHVDGVHGKGAKGNGVVLPFQDARKVPLGQNLQKKTTINLELNFCCSTL